jgi:hypothetical protein
MQYSKPLPPVRDLLTLSQRVYFPIERRQLSAIATNSGIGGPTLTDFLSVFPAGEVFESRVDFMTRAEELEMLINQERTTPAETLRSP